MLFCYSHVWALPLGQAEATIPLALEGGGAALLTCMQQNNAREIVQHLAADPHYFTAVCAALRAAPTSPVEGASPPAALPDERWGGCGEPRPL